MEEQRVEAINGKTICLASNFQLPEEVLDRIDKVAKNNGLSRTIVMNFVLQHGLTVLEGRLHDSGSVS